MSERRARSFLIVLTGSLGDVVRGLPLIDAIKAAEPGAHITWLIEDKWQKILSLHPALDRMIAFERRRGLQGVLELRRALQQERFDVVLDLQRHFKSGVFNRFARAARRIGFHRRDAKEGNWLFQTERIPYRGNGIPKTEHYLLFLDQIGIPRPQKLSFGFERIDSSTLAGEFSLPAGQRRVVVLLGSSWSSKDWFASGYARLLKSILDRTRAGIALVGDGSQTRMADELMEAIPDPRILNLVGRTSLPQLVGILHQAQVAVGPDSGPGHISAAVGTPYVTLFGPTDPVRVAPHGMLDLSVRADIGCAPCMRRTCPGLNKICMRLISPDEVFGQVSRFVS